MRVALFLNEFRPFGGMPRDCLRLAETLVAQGHCATIVTRTWVGREAPSEFVLPSGVAVVLLGRHGWTNRARNRRFIRDAEAWAGQHQPERRVGFMRMPGLDFHFACDPCYEAKVRRLKPAWYRLTPRYRYLAAMEREVFAKGRTCQILLLHGGEVETFHQFHGTERARMHVLPPGIRRHEFRSQDQARSRIELRRELSLSEDSLLLTLIGSGYRTKGLDRAIRALAELPQAQLVVAGQDRAEPFQRLANKLGVANRLHLLGGVDDLDRLMLASDLLVHPAYSENTGTVLLEALVRGLPVLCSGVCGFALHVRAAEAGRVLPEPFSQEGFTETLQELASKPAERRRLGQNGVAYGQRTDLYSCHETACRLITS